MSDETPAREPIGEDARIDALEERLKAAREREERRTQPQAQGTDANYRSGNRALADLLGGVLGGLVLGWLFDWLAGTLPWGLLVGLALGIVVAFRNIIRAANRPPER
ncbi:AtpZ/AtpI family protein [Qipengyuania sediminis]|uniref:AtpZ/AtpI family protein n=1 Tax=Qipengyuania sediminis TaxID=1532023 RepID=UPI001059451B|nr:AtpZ/AtpI family protein [Qipengyuania sediminis]